MEINRIELLDAIKKVKPGLASNEIVEHSTYLAFDKKSIRTFNDEIAIIYPFKSPFKGAVPAIQLFKLLDKLSTDLIDVEVTSSDVDGETVSRLSIKSGRTKAEIVIEPEIKLPKLKTKGLDWQELPDDFCEAITFASFSTSKNMIAPEFTCLSIVKNKITSSDNYRVTERVMESKIDDPFLLPASIVRTLVSYKPVEYAVDDSWVYFQNENKVIFGVRLIEATYPDMSNLFKVDGETITLPAGIETVIDRIQVMVTDDFELERVVSLSISNKGISCKGEGSVGWVEESIRLRHKGAKIEIKTHPAFLIDILKHLSTVTIGESSMLFKGDNFKHVMALQ